MTLATALADRIIFRTITETAAVRILEAYGSCLTDFVDDIEDVGGVYDPASIDAGRLYRFLGY